MLKSLLAASLIAFAAMSIGSSRRGAQSPDTIPAELYGAGLISTGLDELGASFTPDGNELYWVIKTAGDGRIVFSRLRGGHWSAPEVVPFSGRYKDFDPFITPDGRRLFFISNRPRGVATWNERDYDIYVAERQGAGWSEPVNLGAPVNTDGPEYFPSVAGDNTLYFATRRPGSRGLDIYRSRRGADGTYGEPENLGEAISGTGTTSEYDAWIAPDQDMLVFTSERPGAPGDGDLYVSFNRNGQWTPARLLPPAINSPAKEYAPIGSPDHRFLYWTSMRAGDGNIYRAPLSAIIALSR